ITRIDPRLLQTCLRKGMALPPPLRHQDQWKSYCAENHLVDLLKQSTIRLSISELLEGLRPLAPRLYSISSSQNVHPDSVHLTVNVLRYELNQELRSGVTSGFLAQAELGSPAHIFVQPTKSFHLCEDEKPILLIGPGTGIAPFRAFLQEREVRRARGQSWLFFGAQRSAYDFLYQRELEDWVERGVLTRLDTAWSRDQAHKIYVQDLLYQNGYGIWQWLEAGAYVYVCGDAQRMAKDVHQTLLRIVREFGGKNVEEAEQYIKGLKSAKRYLRDVY
ncbi:MAG: hypothetical protein VYD19_01605, partial [Myxococcota bacterium]|nr:hypothetical protein [Myxococcota bacterium]